MNHLVVHAVVRFPPQMHYSQFLITTLKLAAADVFGAMVLAITHFGTERWWRGSLITKHGIITLTCIDKSMVITVQSDKPIRLESVAMNLERFGLLGLNHSFWRDGLETEELSMDGGCRESPPDPHPEGT